MAQNVKLIIGSTRQNRIGADVAAWVTQQAEAAGITLEVLDLKEIALPIFDAPVPPAMGPTETTEGKAWAETIGSADGFIVVTPEYNRSVPSSLKNAIDYLAEEWTDKPAVIVSYGFKDGGLSATSHLKDIFGWLKVDVIEPTVALSLNQDTFKDMNAAFAPQLNTLQKALKQLV